MKPIAIPANMRRSIEDYIALQGPLPEGKQKA